jgi:hypothetical protein
MPSLSNTPEQCKDANQAQPWIDRAAELAAWAMRRLTNRHDAWGAYWQEQTPDGWVTRQTTCPHTRDRCKRHLTEQILARHFAATDTHAVIGLHTTSPENRSRWGAVDIDWHGPTSTGGDVNIVAAQRWYTHLEGLGFHPLLTDSNGAGGFHLRVIFAEPVATAKVFAFLHWLVRDHAALGMATPPEVFPKQARVEPGRYGNWLRLMGKHHARDFWSRVWDGSNWLEGHAAIDKMLSIDGDAPSLIPAAALAPKLIFCIRTAPRKHVACCRGDHLAARIRGYLRKLPVGLGEGMHRDDYGFRYACFLVRDLGLLDGEALDWLQEWDARNAVPKGLDCLRKFITSAHAYGKHAYGSGLPSARRV